MKTNKDKEIRKLLRDHNKILVRLEWLGVIRSSKLIPDYGEYLAAKTLNLQLAKSSVNKGCDAFDSDENKYEIKTRKVTKWSKPTIFPVRIEQLKCADFIVYVELDDDWNLIKLLKIPTSEIKINKYSRVTINKALVKKFSVL